MVPAIIVVCKNTHKLALAADAELEVRRQQNAKLQSAVQLLQDSYSKTFNDRTEYQVSYEKKIIVQKIDCAVVGNFFDT